MNFNKIIAKLQTVFSVTKSELFFVGIVLLGLTMGAVVQMISQEEAHSFAENKDEIYSALDSLASISETTYIGVEPEKSESFPELVEADTVVEKESFFPASKKKEMPADKININSASKVELMKLPGVGEATAMKIIEFRKSSPFKKPEDIMKVKGIGIKKFEKMKQYIITK